MLPEPEIKAAVWRSPQSAQALRIDIVRQVPTAAHNEESVITVCGEIDVATEAQFRAAIDGVLASGQRLIVDVSGTTFMGCCAIRILLAAVEKLGSDRTALVIRRPSPQALRLMQHTRLDTNLTIEANS